MKTLISKNNMVMMKVKYVMGFIQGVVIKTKQEIIHRTIATQGVGMFH